MTKTELIEQILKLADGINRCTEDDFHAAYERIEGLIHEYTENLGL